MPPGPAPERRKRPFPEPGKGTEGQGASSAGKTGACGGKAARILSRFRGCPPQDRCIPPVTPKTSAVMKLDSWDARKTYSPDSSTGCPARLRGVFLAEFRQVFLKLASRHLQGRPDRARRHHIDPDSLGGHLLGQGAAEGDDGRFRGSIVNQVFARLIGLDGGTGDDARSGLEVGRTALAIQNREKTFTSNVLVNCSVVMS